MLFTRIEKKKKKFCTFGAQYLIREHDGIVVEHRNPNREVLVSIPTMIDCLSSKIFTRKGEILSNRVQDYK